MYNLAKEYRSAEGKGQARKQNSSDSSGQGLLFLLRGLMWSQGNVSHGCAPELGHHRKYDHSPPHEGRWHVRP